MRNKAPSRDPERSKQGYQTYIEAQLTKFATFISEHPMNEKRVLRLEQSMEREQEKVMQLESQIKLLSIYHNDNMNQGYKNSQNTQYSEVQQKIQQYLSSHKIDSVESVHEEIFEQLRRLGSLVQNKRQKPPKTTHHVARYQQKTQDSDFVQQEQRRLVYSWCSQHMSEWGLQQPKGHNFVEKKELVEYKSEMKNYFVEKFEKFYKIIRSSIKDQHLHKKIPSDSARALPNKENKTARVAKWSQATDQSPLKKVVREQNTPVLTTAKVTNLTNPPKDNPSKVKRFSVEQAGKGRKTKRVDKGSLSVSQVSSLSKVSKTSRRSDLSKLSKISKANKEDDRKKPKPKSQSRSNQARTSRNHTPAVSVSRDRSLSQSQDRKLRGVTNHRPQSVSVSDSFVLSRSKSKRNQKPAKSKKDIRGAQRDKSKSPLTPKIQPRPHIDRIVKQKKVCERYRQAL